MDMTPTQISDSRASLARTDGTAQWLDLLEDVAMEQGWFEPLGPNHSAIHAQGGTTLLVTCEQMRNIRASEQREPLAWQMAGREGWASLCLMAHERTWFRDPIVFDFLEKLAQEGFFAGYERVLFYGAGISAHAACAFSSLVPGAVVLAISPQATLTPSLAGWDRRFPAARRLDFTSRLGFAPDLCAGAEAVFLLYDPLEDEDAAHAAMFRGANVTHLRARYMNGALEDAMLRTNLLPVLLKTASMGRLSAAGFHRAWRVRRRYFPYLRRLLGRLEGSNHPRRVLWLTEWMPADWLNPRFLRARKNARAALEEKMPAGVE